MRFFLAALAVRPSGIFVPAERFLLDRAALFQDGRLSDQLVFHRARQRAERVQVLHLHPGSQFGGPFRAQRNVCLEADDPLLHVAAVDVQVAQQPAQRGGVGFHFLRRMHIRFRYYFQQRDSGAVEVDQRTRRLFLMRELSGVFFQVDSPDADRADFSAGLDPQRALDRQRQFILRDLIPLGEVRVEIILAREHADRRYPAPKGRGHQQRQVHRPFVYHRQAAGHSQADRAGGGVRLGQGGIDHRAAAEHLRAGAQFRVHFQADNRFPFHVRLLLRAPPTRAGA